MYYSVIVPVYKAELYLKACVDSILAQTYREFELLLVDDGSPDACPAICDAYAAADPRVKVIHQKNSGPAHARKTGLRASTGQYIVFVDGDDWIAPEFLERGRALLGETQAEAILFASSLVYEDHMEVVHEPTAEGIYGEEKKISELYPLILMNHKMEHMLYFISGKIFRRSLAEHGYLAVDDRILLGEDMLGMLSVYLKIQNIYISYERMNFYRIKAQSGSHGFQVKQYQQVSMVLKELIRIRRERAESVPVDFKRQIERYGAYMCFTQMVHAVNDGAFRQLGEIRRQMSRPLLQKCIQRAQFKNISLKTRITYWLFRRNWLLFSYLFLDVCRRIRKYIPKEREK